MTFGFARTSAGRALGDDLAVVEDRDPVADAHDDPHVVLDEQDRQPELGPEPADEVGHLARLAAVHAGRRLVEQEQLRVASRARGRSRAGAGRRTAGCAPTSPAGSSRSTSLSSAMHSSIDACSSRSMLGRAHDRVPPVALEVDVDADAGRCRAPTSCRTAGCSGRSGRSRARSPRAASSDLTFLPLHRDDRLPVEGDLAAGRRRSSPVIMLKNVVLPAPLGPISETIEPRGMSKSTLLTASRPPNRLVTAAGPDEQRRSCIGARSAEVGAELEHGHSSSSLARGLRRRAAPAPVSL